MKSKVVFDASALLALLYKEPGYEIVENHLPKAIISAVNFSETIACLNTKLGVPQAEAETIVSSLISEIVPFDREQAIIAAHLRKSTQAYGFSLGDRACLALAKVQNFPVFTADKAWNKFKDNIDIRIIR